MKLNDFVCTKCGECCRHIDIVKGLRHLQKNGVCKYLVNNECIIYDNRPNLCRRDKVYLMYKDKYSEEEFMEILLKYCNYFKSMSEKQ